MLLILFEAVQILRTFAGENVTGTVTILGTVLWNL